eukprot:2789848-Rhodomonas_salina.2
MSFASTASMHPTRHSTGIAHCACTLHSPESRSWPCVFWALALALDSGSQLCLSALALFTWPSGLGTRHLALRSSRLSALSSQLLALGTLLSALSSQLWALRSCRLSALGSAMTALSAVMHVTETCNEQNLWTCIVTTRNHQK